MTGDPRLPITLRGLTEQERAFAFAYTKFGDAEAAKREARYPDTASGQYILRKPHIALAIRAEIVRLMATEGAAIGFRGLVRIAKDESLPAAAQVAAQKALLQGAGLLEAPQQSGESKSINNMTRDELRDFIEAKRSEIDKMEQYLAEQARVIGSGSASQDIDPFA